MKIKVKYISTKWYDKSSIKQWVWYFRKWGRYSGFTLRILGINFIVSNYKK